MGRRYFPENKILANCFALTERFYYVYKIVIYKTGHFYIGCTGDISSRLGQHMEAICDAKRSFDGEYVYAHKKIAEILCEDGFEKHIDMVHYVKAGLSIKLIAIVAEDRKYAMEIERMAIQDSRDNPLCLNSK
jgi:hypothetical protein